MRILIKGEYLDFEVPIYMGDEQKNRFVEGMKRIFGNRVEVNVIVENKKEIDSIIRKPEKFTEKDYILLANPKLSNEEIAKQIGKSQFAIQMQRGHYLMELQEWARKKGKHSINDITDKDVREFLGEEK